MDGAQAVKQRVCVSALYIAMECNDRLCNEKWFVPNQGARTPPDRMKVAPALEFLMS
jgi:hypothetical protein